MLLDNSDSDQDLGERDARPSDDVQKTLEIRVFHLESEPNAPEAWRKVTLKLTAEEQQCAATVMRHIVTVTAL